MAVFVPFANVPTAPPAIPSYGGRPALKPSIYGFLVALYIFIAGMAGSAQIVATLLAATGPAGAESVVTIGRIMAVAGAVAGAILLIVELHTPRRFYNMLRIFRVTSPMSIGSFVLSGFGFFSLLALLGQFLAWRWVPLASGGIAALLGIVMTCYPAALLTATSTPLWSSAPRLLAVRFGAASMASGFAALCLVALWMPQSLRLAGLLAAAATVSVFVELIAALLARWAYAQAGVNGPMRGRSGLLLAAAEVLGFLALSLYLSALVFGEAAALLMLAASVSVLIAGLTMRDAVLRAGNESARRPEDYFRLARA